MGFSENTVWPRANNPRERILNKPDLDPNLPSQEFGQ